jgi:outer membrane protein assembly factor BamB
LLWSSALTTGTFGFEWVGAAYDGGRVFAVNFDGRLRAIDAATGATAWEVSLPGQRAFSSSPSALSGTVYVGGAGTGGTSYAVDESNGAVRWAQGVENGDDSSPAVSTNGVFVSYACNQAYGFASATGALLWHHTDQCEGGGGNTTALHGGSIYTRGRLGDLRLDAANGAVLGTYTTTFIPAFTDTAMLTTPTSVLSGT